MPIDLTCAKCGRYFQVASLDSGNALECPTCGTLHEPVAPPPPRQADPTPADALGQRRDLEPHRGPLIMVLGIVSLVLVAAGPLVVVGIPFGIVAWVMGTKDLKKIQSGVMDPEDQSKTNAGRICGKVGAIIASVITLFICVMYSMIFGMIVTITPGPGGRPRPMPAATAPAPRMPAPPAPPLENMPLDKERPTPP